MIRVDHFSVGGKKFSKSLVIKDNFKFGLRQKDASKEEESDRPSNEELNRKRLAGELDEDPDTVENGLVSYKPAGDTEFWLHFENGTRLGVEQVVLRRNPQQLIRIDPPPPTPE